MMDFKRHQDSAVRLREFPQAAPTLTTQMKSVGEAMSIGRTFKESLQKCLRSLEIGRSGMLDEDKKTIKKRQ